MILTSFGNAELQRGFPVNSNSIIQNQTGKSLVALRIIYNAVQTARSIEKVPISKKINLDVRMVIVGTQEYFAEKKHMNYFRNAYLFICWKRNLQ